MFKFYNDVQTEDLGGGVSRKVLVHNGNLMAVEVHFEEGSRGVLHYHPHEQLTYVLSGKFEFTIGTEKHIVMKGDTLYKTPNILHGCVCLEQGYLLDVFTPQRTDFIK